jgi:hypothetical protein
MPLAAQIVPSDYSEINQDKVTNMMDLVENLQMILVTNPVSLDDGAKQMRRIVGIQLHRSPEGTNGIT